MAAWAIPAAIGIGSAIAGGFGANKAAKRQAEAIDRATALEREMFTTTRNDLTPYREAGTQGLEALLPLLGLKDGGFDPSGIEELLQSQPGYQFNLEQGLDAINKGAAARGDFYAPKTLKDLGKFQGGYASGTYDKILERLLGVSGMGQNAAVQTGNFGQQSAGRAGDLAIQGGNAAAAGIMGRTNAITGAAGDAYNQYLLSTVLGNQQPNYGRASAGEFFP